MTDVDVVGDPRIDPSDQTSAHCRARASREARLLLAWLVVPVAFLEEQAGQPGVISDQIKAEYAVYKKVVDQSKLTLD
mgnify:CR=1 FL=1